MLSIEPTTHVPSRVASHCRERPSSSTGDHNSSEMAGAPPVGRRARATRTTTSNYVRTALFFGAHSLSRLLVASVPRQLCHLDHPAAELPKPHPSRAHSSSRLWVASVPRQLVAWTTPQRNCPSPHIRLIRSALSQHVAPCQPRAALPAHVISASGQHKPQDRPSTCSFFCASGLRHMHDEPRISKLESVLRVTSDGDFAC